MTTRRGGEGRMRRPRDMTEIQEFHDKEHPGIDLGQCPRCQYQRRRMCTGKVNAFAERDDVAAFVLEQNRANNYKKPLTWYRCAWCTRYHITSRLGLKRKRVTKEGRKWQAKQERIRRGTE